MGILNFFSEYIIHLIFVIGLIGIIAGFLFGSIPFISTYSLPIKVISILVFSIGVYLQGGLAEKKETERKIKEVEIKVKTLETQAANLNTQLQSTIYERDELIKNKGQTIIKYIDRYRDREILKTIEGPERVRVEEIIKYVESCPIPKEFLDIHNQAARLNRNDVK